MKDQLKYIAVGVAMSAVNQGVLKLSESEINMLNEPDHWKLIADKFSIITNKSTWCFEFQPDTEDEYPFLQIELTTTNNALSAGNIITNEENRITSYS